jgi:hypothetical protein
MLTEDELPAEASLLNALSDSLGQHTMEDVPQTLKLEAAHYFGSLEKAIAVLKKQGDRLPGWNKRKVMTGPFPDAPIETEPGLRYSPTSAHGSGKCRRSPFW